jgi:hypothetical protein
MTQLWLLAEPPQTQLPQEVRLLLRLVPVLVRGLVRELAPARELVPELLLVPELVPELLPELLQALLQARLQVPELLRLPRQPPPLRLLPTRSRICCRPSAR